MKRIFSQYTFAVLLSLSFSLGYGQNNNPLNTSETYQIYSDRIVQSDFTANAVSPSLIYSNYRIPINLYQYPGKNTKPQWRLSLDINAFPQYRSDYVLVDALYNMSLEEMVRAVEKDSTLRTGKEWAGVWTRDVSYSIILSMAILQTKVAQYSLMRKVNNGVIIQDTGTGGAYPISTDRMIWAVAAWEIYKVTGDKQWLKTTYSIIKKSLEADLQNAIDPVTGLVKGESSFLDWREQTYPDWMQPADIYESQCLGTNAVHYQAHFVLASMADELKDNKVAAKHKSIAETIKNAVNKYLWQDEKGYYGQYLYGRNFKMLSPKSEALGEALCILFDIASPERQKQIVEKTPVISFGIPCIYPQIPNIPPYHNNAVWPFVQSYWTMACAKTGNSQAVMESLSAIYRPAALFLTNKENFVASNGDFAGTQINSDNMLWSLSGNISMIYKVLFGMEYTTKALRFKPFVPASLQGNRTLTNYKYRNAVLDIEMQGYGNEIKSITLDGKPLKNAEVQATLTGKHVIKIELAKNSLGGSFNKVQDHVSPEAPRASLDKMKISWPAVNGAKKYKVIKNGKLEVIKEETFFNITDQNFSEYQVIAIDEKNNESFASEPLVFVPDDKVFIIEAEATASTPTAASNAVKTSLSQNSTLNFVVSVKEDGLYSIDFKYANGNGPINTENKCAIRTLKLNDQTLGCVVLPQRGTNNWSNWGFTNSITAQLKKGTNKVTLAYEPHNLNMNSDINEALVDYLRIIRIK